MTYGSLFSGIGGFDLAFDRCGMTPAWQCEIDNDASRVLEHHWPGVKRYTDIRTMENPPIVDVICGGFPCQDLSVAGQRAGMAGERSGLFWEMLRVVDEVQPSYFLFENVPGLASSDGGRDFARVLSGLAKRGYLGCTRTLDSRFFGVPQRRRRIFGVFARGRFAVERCAEILALTEGSGRHPQAGRKKGKAVASTIRIRSETSCSTRELNDAILHAERVTDKALHLLRQTVGEEAVEWWCCGIVARFWKPEILWPQLHGGKLRSTAGEAESDNIYKSLARSQGRAKRAMLEMWHDGQNARPPQRRESTEQLAGEFRAIVSQMSQSEASQQGCLQAMRKAPKGLGILQQALHSLQATWGYEGQSEIATTLRSRMSGPGVNPPGRGGEDDSNLILSNALRSSGVGVERCGDSRRQDPVVVCFGSNRQHGEQQLGNVTNKNRQDFETETLIAHTLSSAGSDGSEDGTGRGTPLTVFQADDYAAGTFESADQSRPLTTSADRSRGGPVAVFQTRIARNGRGQPKDIVDNLTSSEGGSHADSKPHVFGGGQMVRRLTPTECLRLQAFPDDWLDLDPPLSDSAKYRLIGNAVTVNVVEWIAKRIPRP